MKISEINIIPIKPRDGLLGFVTFVLDDQFYVGNVGIHSTPDGNIRLLYPDRCLPNGKVVSSFHPIAKHIGLEITQQVTLKYNDLVIRATSEQVRKTCHEKPQQTTIPS
jgi:DNA-binding cell septation regulator SpoVG